MSIMKVRPVALWVHQREALEQARKRRRLLVAHECGAGKTRTAIEFLRESREAPDAPSLCLVVAPLSAHSVWRQHILAAEFAYELCVVHGSNASRPEGRAVVLCGYELLRRALARGWKKDKPVNIEERPGELRRRRGWRRETGHWLLDGPFCAVVADEVQEVRAANSDRAQALSVACGSAAASLGLSGTPVNKDTEELRNILQALAVPKDASDRAPLAYVHAALAPACAFDTQFERVLYDLRDLSATAASGYNAQLCAARDALKANEPMPRIHCCLQRLELAAVHPALLERSLASRRYDSCDADRVATEGSPHLRSVLEAVRAATNAGHTLVVVVAPQTHILRAVADFLSPRLPHAQYWYTGAGTETERERMRRAFVQHRSEALLFLSQKAGGQALSLVPAAALVFAGLWFTHVSHDQTVGRVRRTGQERPAHVYYVGARHGLLEAVLSAQEQDRARARAIMRGDGGELLPSAARRIVSECSRAPVCVCAGGRGALRAETCAH